MNKKMLVFVVISFLLWRLFLFLPLFAFQDLMEYRNGYEYTSIKKFTQPNVHAILNAFFLSPFANFDGVHYVSIAGNGYTNNLGFFPLYPLIIKTVSLLFGAKMPFDMAYFSSAFLVSHVAFLLSLFVFYKLLLFDYSNNQTKQAILYLLIFPTSFFFGSLYSESLFLLFLFLSFYCARKKQWFFASMFGMLLTLTRFVGVCIFPALLYEYLKNEKQPVSSLLKSKLFLIPFGLIGYAVYNFIIKQDFLYFIHAQGNFANNRSVTGIVFPLQTLYRYIKIVLTLPQSQFEWWIALLEIASFVFACIALFLAWKKKIRVSYIIFAVLAVMIPAMSGTFTGLPRYILVAFPLYIVLALLEQKVFKFFYIFSSLILLLVLLFFFSKGYYVA